MATGSGNNDRPSLVQYSTDADFDLADIHTHTAKIWGKEQAHRYTDFLLDAADEVARGETRGKPIARRPGRFLITATWHNARDGHHIVYEIIPEGIRVIRILHTAMELKRHIPI
jgi:plasmid stabilization system protein ParE